LFERPAGNERSAQPMVNESAGDSNLPSAIERVQLFQVELAAVKLPFDFPAAVGGQAIEVEKLPGQAIGVHSSLGELAVAFIGGQGFGAGLTREYSRWQA